MKKLLLSCCLLLLGLYAFAGPVDYQKALQMARNNNKPLQIAKQQLLQAQADYYDIRGSLLPQVSVEGGYTLSHTRMPDSVTQPMPSLGAALDDSSTPASDNEETIADFVDNMFSGMAASEIDQEASLAGAFKLSQVLFSSELINGLDVARKVATLRNKNYELTQIDIDYQTTQYFYSTLLANQAVDINRQALETARQHFDQVKSMFAQGQVSQYDQLRAELEVSKLEPSLHKAENDYDLALQNLKKHIGMEDADIELVGSIEAGEFSELTLQDALTTGISNRLELQIAAINTACYDVQLTVEKQSWMPSLALNAEYDIYTAADNYGIESDDFGDVAKVGIGFSMPIFTGLSNSYKRDKARAQLREAQLNQSDAEESIRLDIRNSWLNRNYIRGELEVSRRNVDLADKALQIAQARYDQSVGIQLEVFDAQLELKSARLQFLQTAYNALMADETLKKAMGTERL